MNFSALKKDDCTLEIPGWRAFCYSVTPGVTANGMEKVDITFVLIRNETVAAKFTEQPKSGVAHKSGSYTFSWATDVPPAELVLQVEKPDGEWVDLVSLLGKSSYSVSYDERYAEEFVNATYADGSSEIIHRTQYRIVARVPDGIGFKNSISNQFSVKWGDTFTLTGLDVTASEVYFEELREQSWLLNQKITPAWSGARVNITEYTTSSTALYTDPACTEALRTEPKQGGSYYVRYRVYENSNTAKSGKKADFSRLRTSDCALTLEDDGYDVECVGVETSEFSGGFAYVNVVFKLTKTSPDPVKPPKPTVYYPLWVAGVQVTDLNMDNVLGDDEYVSVVFTPGENGAPARLALKGAYIKWVPDSTVSAQPYAGIYSEGIDLVLELTGYNSIGGGWKSGYTGIWIKDGDLIIESDNYNGALDVRPTATESGELCGVRADSITINSGKATASLSVNGTGAGTTETSYGVYAPNGVTVKGGYLTVSGYFESSSRTYGIRGAVTVYDGATVEAAGGTRAFEQAPVIADGYQNLVVKVNTGTSPEGASNWNKTAALGGSGSQFKYVSVRPVPPPFIDDLPLTIMLGEYYYEEFRVWGGSFEFVGLPDWLWYDDAFYVLSGTPEAAGVYTFTVNATNAEGVSVSKTFELEVLPVELEPHGITVTNGFAVNPSDSTIVKSAVYGEEIYVKPDAVEGKYVTGWTCDDPSVEVTRSGWVYTWKFTMPNKDVVITPVYADQTHVTMDLSKYIVYGNLDRIQTSQLTLIYEDLDGLLTYSDNSNYAWLDLDGNGVVDLELSNWNYGYKTGRQTGGITGDYEVPYLSKGPYWPITIKFLEHAPCKITFDVNGGIPKDMELSTLVEYGAIRSVSGPTNEEDYATYLEPPANTEFAGWEIDGVFYALGTRITITGDITVKYIWKQPSVNYTVSLTASPSAGGTVSGGGSYPDASPVNITASAKPGYKFEGWYEGETLVSRDASYTFIVAQGNRSLTARFRLIPTSGYTVSGTAAGWNGTDDSVYLLYDAGTDDSTIRAAWQKGTHATLAGVKSYSVIREDVEAATVDGKEMYAQSFSFEGVANGSYKLAVFKPGKYVPKIVAVTVSGGDVTLGTFRLWLYGDVTGDGKVNSTDATQIQRYFAGKTPVTFGVGSESDIADKLLAADVNNDNKINSTDATQIQRYFAGRTPTAFSKLK